MFIKLTVSIPVNESELDYEQAEAMAIEIKYKNVWVKNLVNPNHISCIDPRVTKKGDHNSIVYTVDGIKLYCKETVDQIEDKINKSTILLNKHN